MWLFVPSPSAPDTAASKSDSVPLSSLSDSKAVLPLTWSGKPMPLRSLRAAWKRAPWMRRLSGLTSLPSTLERGVAQWIASLRDSHVSHTAMPEAAKVSTTNVGSGPTSCELFASLERGLWCSKTLQDSFLPADSLPYSQTWPKWGSMRNGECFLRDLWVPAIGASESSSWPTVTTASANGNAQTAANPLPGQTGGDTIAGVAQQWQTPVVPKGGGLTRGGDRSGEALLAGQSMQWTTPQAHDVSPRGSGQKPSSAAGNACLARDSMNWPTPNAHDGRRPGVDDKSTQGGNLNRDAATWPTPASRDAKGANSELHVTETGGGRKHMDQLANFAAHSSLPAPVMPDGPESSQNAPSSRPRLNPAFVCWLMGLPPAWTNIEHTSFGAEEMALYHYRLQSELSRCCGDSDSRSKAA